MASKNSAIINKKLKIINAKLSDNFKGIKILKTMGKESFLINQFLNDYKILRNSEKGVMLAKHTLIILREPIAVIFLTMLIYFYVVHMQLDFSKVIVISILFYRILTTLNQVQAEYLVINIAQEYFWSMDDILSKSRKAKEITEKKKKLKKFNSLQLKNISFSFGNKDIFKNANFVLKKNNLTLLHGKSGIGKTTLMDIIVGFYKPDNGQMFLNKENFFDYDIKSFRKKIGYVSQDQFLYNETILRNICLDKRIDKNKIEKILIEADCKSFVNKLPKKINTIVGEKGTNLSGGQKQRLSIARALLQNPDLIILDEPTVGLDHKNKEIILRKLKQLSENKTIIIVSHDKYVFKYADFIYNINSQKLVRV
jgi:ABC-type bacteriocin/lantibiotic exporter with double-glycine peptidase domain